MTSFANSKALREHVGKRLKTARQLQVPPVGQTQAAQLIGKLRTTYASYELGKCLMPVRDIATLEQAWGLPEGWIMSPDELEVSVQHSGADKPPDDLLDLLLDIVSDPDTEPSKRDVARSSIKWLASRSLGGSR